MSKDFQAEMIPSKAEIGTNREFPLLIMISRQPADFVDKMSEAWSSENCLASFTNESFLSRNVMVQSEGVCEVISEINYNNNLKKSSSTLFVNPKVIPVSKVKFSPIQPIDVSKPFEFSVLVMNLIPKCVGFWNLNSGEFRKTAGDDEKLKDIGMTVINDFEEYFLQELVDYDNNTISKVIFSSNI